ncbi:MAG: LppX_LprAFG lipoprotein [Dehalococcoidia bacterium]|nr:LppX_LprAFG lipoprotein [Dehalococcoidia bacterium]
MTVNSTIATLLGTVFIAAMLVGCGHSPQPDPTAVPDPTPTPIDVAALLTRSGAATSALNTFRFQLEHNREGATPLTESLRVTEADGRVVNPDAVSVDFAGTLGSFAVRSSLITLGDDSYMTNPLTGAWEQVAREVSPLGFFDPQRGIGSMMTEVQSPVLIEKSDSEFVIEGALPVEALEPLLGGLMEGNTVDVRLNIDSDSLYLTRAILDGRLTASEPDGVVRTITLSEFNEQVTIEPPG